MATGAGKGSGLAGMGPSMISARVREEADVGISGTAGADNRASVTSATGTVTTSHFTTSGGATGGVWIWTVYQGTEGCSARMCLCHPLPL